MLQLQQSKMTGNSFKKCLCLVNHSLGLAHLLSHDIADRNMRRSSEVKNNKNVQRACEDRQNGMMTNGLHTAVGKYHNVKEDGHQT